ncbi:MAG: GtrA family protein [Anaerolineales bacterium]|jgi:putative flippase GtrA
MAALSPRARRELVRFLKFSVVGTIGAVVDFGTFNLLVSWLHVWDIAAGIFSFLAAITSNFIWNRYWTYPDSRSKPVRQQAVQFAVVNGVGLAIRVPIYALAVKPMSRLAEWIMGTLPPLSQIFPDPTSLGRNMSLALAVIVVLFWNFGINRIWTYSDVN